MNSDQEKLFELFENKDIENIQIMIAKNTALLYEKYYHDNTVLHYAAQ